METTNTQGRLQPWKRGVATACAVVLAIIFIVAGLWKLTDPFTAGVRMEQMRVPGGLGVPVAILVGILETVAGLLLVIPSYRRWGAWLCAALLVVFMVYVGAQYEVLRGEDCTCFPWLERVVGPWFFISDALMLVLAIIAGWWAVRPVGLRVPAMVLAGVTVFAITSYGVAVSERMRLATPETITANGHTIQLRQGKVFIYFFDPECSHCDMAARELATLDWTGTEVIAVATRMPQFAEQFLQDTGLQAELSPDLEKLRQAFPFTDAPYAIALENGRVVEHFTTFDEVQPMKRLRELGFAR